MSKSMKSEVPKFQSEHRCRVSRSRTCIALAVFASLLAPEAATSQSTAVRVDVEVLRPAQFPGSSLFGVQVEVIGDEVLVSAPYYDNRGIVRRYSMRGGRMEAIGEIQSPWPTHTRFGMNLTSFGDDILYVAAPYYAGLPNRIGAVVEFRRSATNDWVHTRTVSATEYAPGMYPVAVDATQLMFGTSVGPTATVIGPGVHIFDRDPITGDLTPGQILRPRPAVVGGGFGAELALAQDVLAVAANVMTLPGSFSNAGEVNLFRRTQGVWQLEAVLHSPTPGFLRLFGQALAITPDATRVYVGEPGITQFPAAPGRVYEFVHRGGGTWEVAQTLEYSGAYLGDGFGGAISLDGDRLVVGAARALGPGDIGGFAVLFERDAQGVWREVDVLRPEAHGQPSQFGWPVLAHGEMVFIGDPTRLYSGLQTLGALELFQRPLGHFHCAATTPAVSELQVFAANGVDVALPAARLRDWVPGPSYRVLALSAAAGPPAGVQVPLCIGVPILRRCAAESVGPGEGGSTESWFRFDEPWFRPFLGQRLYVQGLTFGGAQGVIASPGHRVRGLERSLGNPGRYVPRSDTCTRSAGGLALPALLDFQHPSHGP